MRYLLALALVCASCNNGGGGDGCCNTCPHPYYDPYYDPYYYDTAAPAATPHIAYQMSLRKHRPLRLQPF